ncbi:MAG: Omp28-related outer membrane protein [Cyclobacteriaceae bacterium]|nr:Omp28-related outer membrane protein [Cyclobacteriaceae bacterium]
MKRTQKTLSTISLFAALIVMLTFNQCNESANTPIPTSISIYADKTTAQADDVIKLTIKTNLGTDVTAKSIIVADMKTIIGSTFSSSVHGTHTITATYSGLSSKALTITITPSPNQKFVKRVLFDLFTGTWCGWCPLSTFELEQLNKKTNLIVPIEIHKSSSYSSFKEPFDAAFLATEYMKQINPDLFGVPTVVLDRKIIFEGGSIFLDQYEKPVFSLLAPKADIGIAMSSSLAGSIASITVKAKFASTLSNLKLVVVVLEDNLIYDQTNYTDLYGGASKIKNFVNDNVLRALLTKSILGDPITEATPAGFELTKKFTYTIPSTYQKDKLHFVAFIVNSAKEVINVRSGNLGETQQYEY